MNKKILFSIIAVLVVAIVGVGVSIYYQHKSQSPEVVVKKMLLEMQKVNSFQYKGSFRINYEDEKEKENFYSPEKVNLSMIFNGLSDSNDFENLRNYFSFEAKVNAVMMNGALDYNANISAELKNFGKTLYLKLNNITDFGFYDLTPLINKWIKIDGEKYTEEMGTDMEKEYLTQKELLKEIEEEFLKRDIIKITEVLSNKKIDRITVYNYKFVLDKEELLKFLIFVEELHSKNQNEKNDYTGLIEKTKEGLDILDFLEGELLIGKKDFLLYGFSYNFIKDEDNVLISSDIEVLIREHNKTFVLEIPAESKDIEEVINELFGGIIF